MSEFETDNPVPIQAIGRLFKGDLESTIRTGKLAVNLGTRVVSVDDQPVHLTGKEYAILELLSLRKGTILTKEMFLNHLYPPPSDFGGRVREGRWFFRRRRLAEDRRELGAAVARTPLHFVGSRPARSTPVAKTPSPPKRPELVLGDDTYRGDIETLA